jgi:hypothetical protein
VSQEVHAYGRIEKATVAASLLGQGALYRHSLRYLAEAFAGQPAYLAGLRINGDISLTAAAGVNTYANHAYVIQRALRNVRLVVAGHEHLQNIDGEDLVIDEAIRTGYSRVALNSFDALATGANTEPVDVCIRLDNPRAITERRHDQVVPLGLFKDDQNNYLEFQVGTSLDTGTDLVVASGGFASGLTITAYVVFRDELVQHTPWVLRSFTVTDLEHVIQARGAIEYLMNVNRKANALGRVDHSATDWQYLKLGGELLHSALTSADYVNRQIFDRFNPGVDGPLSNIGWKNDQATSTHGWSGTPLFMPPPDARKTKLPRGELAIKVGTMPSAFTDNRIRYLLRSTGLDNADHAERVAQGLGVDPRLVREGAAIFSPKATAGGGAAAASIIPKTIKARSRFAGPNRRRGF